MYCGNDPGPASRVVHLVNDVLDRFEEVADADLDLAQIEVPRLSARSRA